MYTEISVAETTAKQFSTMQEAAEAILEKALKKARKKLPAKYQAMSLDKVMQRSDFLAYFKYTLAQEIRGLRSTCPVGLSVRRIDQSGLGNGRFPGDGGLNHSSVDPGDVCFGRFGVVYQFAGQGADRCSSRVAFGRIRPTSLLHGCYSGNSNRCRK